MLRGSETSGLMPCLGVLQQMLISGLSCRLRIDTTPSGVICFAQGGFDFLPTRWVGVVGVQTGDGLLWWVERWWPHVACFMGTPML